MREVARNLSSKICDSIVGMYGDDVIDGISLAVLTYIGTFAENPRKMLDEFCDHLKSQPIEKMVADGRFIR